MSQTAVVSGVRATAMWPTDSCRRDPVDWVHVPYLLPAVGLMQVTRIPADASPIAWLFDTVKERRGGDVLAPITVVFPSAGAALSTRRAFGRKGSVNVHCTLVPRLA